MTAMSLLIEDRTPGQPPTGQISLQIPQARIKVRELIRLYVAEQVERFNSQRKARPSSHYEAPEEGLLNSSNQVKLPAFRDCQTECERALQAFQTNSIFLMVDGQQISDLEEEIVFRTDTKVSFLRLVPLVGG